MKDTYYMPEATFLKWETVFDVTVIASRTSSSVWFSQPVPAND